MKKHLDFLGVFCSFLLDSKPARGATAVASVGFLTVLVAGIAHAATSPPLPLLLLLRKDFRSEGQSCLESVVFVVVNNASWQTQMPLEAREVRRSPSPDSRQWHGPQHSAFLARGQARRRVIASTFRFRFFLQLRSLRSCCKML